MKKLMFTLLVLFCGVAHAECKTGNVYSDIECFEKQLKTDKAKMNKIYNKLASNLDSEGKASLENSQKAWLDYRTKQCSGLMGYYGSQALGAGSHLIILSCEADKTKERLNELKSLDL
ncbi:lysozyme inhibitor LprI family protein [Acinetobacter lactucae]|uniref:lysozyme inhibitor LprI family protein n=1 Tax=Acinetobacter lactucae TaxID=1785128 RepID=UPI00124C9FBE|nr:lysozyme inhibitor LprI family protein [Acinetobacter lactucae]